MNEADKNYMVQTANWRSHQQLNIDINTKEIAFLQEEIANNKAKIKCLRKHNRLAKAALVQQAKDQAAWQRLKRD